MDENTVYAEKNEEILCLFIPTEIGSYIFQSDSEDIDRDIVVMCGDDAVDGDEGISKFSLVIPLDAGMTYTVISKALEYSVEIIDVISKDPRPELHPCPGEKPGIHRREVYDRRAAIRSWASRSGQQAAVCAGWRVLGR